MKATTTHAVPRRGVISAPIGGETRTFKFGMNTLSQFARLHADLPGDFGDQFTKDPIGALRDMAYCGLLVRAAENNLPEGFTAEVVGDWIDEMEQADWEAVVKAMLEAMALGNPNRATLSQAAQ